jgi:hypothetical protein
MKTSINKIIGVGNLSNSKVIHALKKAGSGYSSSSSYGISICDEYIDPPIRKELTINNITCKRCLRILKINTDFIKKEEFMIR